MSTMVKRNPTETRQRMPFKVADLGLAELGRKEIRLAEQEMPGLVALRQRYGAANRSPGRKSSTHST